MYAHVDIFTCGNKCIPENGIHYIIEKLKSKKNKIINIKRGIAHEQ
jgi:S-adenosylmethionine/arginine decarboxylase-like enzyme